jgi:hypothetical protein
MTEPLEKPSINLSEICERDALTYRVGNYFETFSNVEQHLSFLVGATSQHRASAYPVSMERQFY